MWREEIKIFYIFKHLSPNNYTLTRSDYGCNFFFSIYGHYFLKTLKLQNKDRDIIFSLKRFSSKSNTGM